MASTQIFWSSCLPLAGIGFDILSIQGTSPRHAIPGLLHSLKICTDRPLSGSSLRRRKTLPIAGAYPACHNPTAVNRSAVASTAYEAYPLLAGQILGLIQDQDLAEIQLLNSMQLDIRLLHLSVPPT